MSNNEARRSDDAGQGFYSRFTPETFTCKRCGEERNRIDDGETCLKCRWEMKAEVSPRGFEKKDISR